MIALIDYGAGNLTSVRKALAALDVPLVTPSSPAELDGARGIIVPGVGHFDATRAIDEPWREAIQRAVTRGASLFGICLGMQWLFDGSTEAPGVPGFGAFRGICGHLTEFEALILQTDPAPLRSSTQKGEPVPLRKKIPHVGWNSLDIPRETTIMAGIAPGTQVYFTHSYAAPVTADAAALTTYGAAFAAAVERGRIAGVQFHPEKSGDAGLRILDNWLSGCLGRDEAARRAL